MSENLQFPIPNSVLEPYIKQAVSTAITAALGDGTKLVEQAVQAALSQKVGVDGIRRNSDYENRYVLAETVATNKIQQVAREVINEMAEGMRPQIKAAIERQLKTKHSAIAKMLVDTLIGSLSAKWNVNVTLETPKD